MKKTIIALMLFVAAAVAYSCTSKEEPMSVDQLVSTPTAVIEDFILDGPDTKTVVHFNGDNAPTFTFTTEDILGVYPTSPEAGDQQRFTVKEIDGTTATFTGNGFALKPGEKYAAYYPADIANAAAATMSEIPVDYTGQVQPGKTTFGIAKADYLVAKGIEPVNGECTFAMHHVGALVVMDVKFPAAGTFTELSLTSDGAPFVTEGTMNIKVDPSTINIVTAEATSSAVSLALGENGAGISVSKNETVRFCLMVAQKDLSAATLTLKLKDSNNEEISTEIAGKNFTRGKAYKYTCNLEGGDTPTPTEPTNLSEIETANCYIVDVDNINPLGYYFDATVGGNGQTVNFAAKNFVNANCWPYVNGAYTSSLPAGGNVRVVLNQNNCVEDVYYADGFIHFTATGAKGNAQLLLMDAANDDPAWVWHIWCTDAPSIITLTDASSWGFTYQIMDRNLGAIRATFDDPTNSNNSLDEVCGLYYQYGNPTGFTWDEFSAASVNSKGWRMVDGIAGAAKYRKPYLDISSDYYWFNPYSGSANQLYGLLWGGGSAGDGSLNRGPAATKTMYDPCPVGYKVVPIDFSISASDSGDQYGWYKNGSDGSVYFPYNGCAWEGGNFWMGRGYVPDGDTAHYTALWTSGHNNRNMAYFYNCYSKDVNRAGGGTVTDHIVARGMGVRCVAE